MQVFRAALKTFFRHKVYIVVYMVALSFMAVFIGMSIANTPQDEFETERPPIAIIDRDKSSLSLGISTFLEEHADLVETEDSRQALQDTVAQNRAVYTLIVPQGFGKDFVASAGEGKTPPALETLTSYESSSAHMIDALVNKYLDTASLYAASNAAYSQADIASFAHSDMVHETNLQMLWFSSSSPLPEQWLAYMMFASYIVILSIVVNAGLILAAFNRSEIRRRNLSSSVSTLSRNLQLAAACVVVTLITWVWVSILGLVVFGQAFGGVDVRAIGLILFSLFIFCIVALSISFFLGQLTASEFLLNAAGNITGLVFSFLGGIWIPLELVGGTIAKLARFAPTFYYGEALEKTNSLRDYSGTSLAPIFADLGIMLLFAAALFAVALAVGRLRMQSADAGGNAAAARIKS